MVNICCLCIKLEVEVLTIAIKHAHSNPFVPPSHDSQIKSPNATKRERKGTADDALTRGTTAGATLVKRMEQECKVRTRHCL